MLLHLLDLVKTFLPTIIADFGDVYGSKDLTPFQGVTGGLAVLGWLVSARDLLRARMV